MLKAETLKSEGSRQRGDNGTVAKAEMESAESGNHIAGGSPTTGPDAEGAAASRWHFGGAPVSKPAYRVLLLQGVRQTIRAL
jgi:hypothetical protein